MRQFYLDTSEGQLPRPGQQVALDSEESHHLFTVLRGGRQQELNLTDGRGHRFTARSLGGDRRRADLEILTVQEDAGETAAPRLVLACAVVKTKRFEWALEKAVEMGAHRIVPLRTEHGVIAPQGGKVQRWQTILKAALKQSGRSWLPQLAELVNLDDFLAQASPPLLFGAAPGEDPGTVPWTTLLDPVPDPLPDHLTLLVGPEGGWSPAEREGLGKCGARPVGLGPHILRTETAAVAGLHALQALRQSWNTGSAASG